MKITLDYLVKLNSCLSALCLFANTPELHDIELPDNNKKIIVSNKDLFNHISWLINKTKNEIKIKKLRYQKDNYWEERSYDEKGNLLLLKNSNDYWKEMTYDENGNLLTCKDSKGYWEERSYDEKGNLLTHKNSDGYWEKRSYNKKGELISIEISEFENKKYDLKKFKIIKKGIFNKKK